MGDAGNGVLTTLHYANTMDSEENRAFVAAYQEAYGAVPDAYAVHGYDTGMMLALAMHKVAGNTEDKEALIEALANVELESPRGPLRFSDSHHPIQNI